MLTRKRFSFSASNFDKKDETQHISIDDCIVHRQGLLNRGTYVTYRVNTLRTDHKNTISVRRRYRDFEKLFKSLSTKYPDHALAKLPEKKTFELGKFKPEFIESRRKRLEDWLLGLAIHPVLGESPDFCDFLMDEDMNFDDEDDDVGCDSFVSSVGYIHGDGMRTIAEEENIDAEVGDEMKGSQYKSLEEGTLRTINAVAKEYHSQERFEEAKAMFLQVLQAYDLQYGPYHKRTLKAIENLASCVMDEGDLEEAKEYFLQAFSGREKTFGPEHPSTLRTAGIIANILQDTHADFKVTQQYYMRAISGYENSQNGDASNPELLQTLLSYGTLLESENQIDDAQMYLDRAATGFLNLYGPEHVSTLAALSQLANIYSEQHDFETAMALYEQTKCIKEKLYGYNHPITLETIGRIAMILQLQGKDEEALVYYNRYADGVGGDSDDDSGEEDSADSDDEDEGDPTNAPRRSSEQVSLTSDPVSSQEYERYVKMLKVGVPMENVKKKMVSEGMDASLIKNIEKEVVEVNKFDGGDTSDNNCKEGDSKEEMVKILDHPMFSKYIKMKKAGVPKEAIAAKMELEGMDVLVLERDPQEWIPLDYRKKKEGPSVVAKEHPQLAKYFKMIRLGLPKDAAKQKMTQENMGDYVSLLDKDPDELISVALNIEERESSIGGLKIKKKGLDVRRKRLHWKALDASKIRNTLWAEDEDGDDDEIQVNEEEFKRLFVEATSPITKKNLEKAENKKGRINLIDLKRGQNAGIALARIKFSDDVLRRMILTLDARDLTSEQLKSMDEFLPTFDEIKLIEAYAGDESLLGRAEQYMSAMKGLGASASKRIKCLLFKQQFSSSVAGCKKMVDVMERACDDVKLSSRFKKVLKTVLKVGNQLNDGLDNKEEAHQGFTVDSLLKLQSAKAFDKKTSILQYVVTLIERSDPNLNKFTDDLPLVYDASRLNLENIIGECNLVRKHLSSCTVTMKEIEEEKEKEDEKNRDSLDMNSRARSLSSEEMRVKSKIGMRLMNEFLVEAEMTVQELQTHVESVKTKYSSVLEWFGEESNMQSHDFFSTLHKFLVDFSKTHGVVERIINNEKEKEKEKAPGTYGDRHGEASNGTTVRGDIKSRRATVAATTSTSSSSRSLPPLQPVVDEDVTTVSEGELEQLKQKEAKAEADVDSFLDNLFDASACSHITEFCGDGLLLSYGDKSLPEKSRRATILAHLQKDS